MQREPVCGIIIIGIKGSRCCCVRIILPCALSFERVRYAPPVRVNMYMRYAARRYAMRYHAAMRRYRDKMPVRKSIKSSTEKKKGKPQA